MISESQKEVLRDLLNEEKVSDILLMMRGIARENRDRLLRLRKLPEAQGVEIKEQIASALTAEHHRVRVIEAAVEEATTVERGGMLLPPALIFSKQSTLANFKVGQEGLF